MSIQSWRCPIGCPNNKLPGLTDPDANAELLDECEKLIKELLQMGSDFFNQKYAEEFLAKLKARKGQST